MVGHAPPHGGEDWRKTLRTASFRGAFFWVESDGVEGGRRIAIHEFPLAELPYNEDLGQQARRYEVNAYVVGGQASRQAKTFIEACTRRGPATLVLPMFGSIVARCMEISTNRSKDKHGFVAFRVRFVADGLSLSALGGTPHYKTRVRNASKKMPAVVRQAFKNHYKGVGVPDYIIRSALATSQDYLAEWSLIIDSAALRGKTASDLLATVADLYEDLEPLLASGQTGNTYTLTSYRASGEDVDTDPFVDAILEVHDKYAAIAEPSTQIDGFISLIDWSSGDSLPPIPNTTLSRAREQENQDTLLALFRRSALAQLAVAVTEATYPSRRDAVAARMRIATLFNNELEGLRNGEQWEVLEALRELQGLTIEYLSKLIADLAPIIQVEAHNMMPSIYWAYRLYADAERADELSARNHIKHPSFMPTVFEAQSR